MVTEVGPDPTATSGFAWKVPSPLPNRTETLLEPEFWAARSILPSPLKSAFVTVVGVDPTGTGLLGAGRKLRSAQAGFAFTRATSTVATTAVANSTSNVLVR